MQNNPIKILVWHLRGRFDQLGLIGTAGIGLLAFSAVFYLSAVLPLGKEVKSLSQEETLMQARRASSMDQLGQQPEGQLAAFYKSFPHAKSLPESLEKLHQAALTQNVNLDEGEYNLVHNGADRMMRYEINLPVKGDYVHTRKFLSQLLADMPNISLDSVDFERRKISDTVVDARLKLTLFLLDN